MECPIAALAFLVEGKKIVKYLLLLLIKIHLVLFLRHSVSVGVNLDHKCLLSIKRLRGMYRESVCVSEKVCIYAAVLELKHHKCFMLEGVTPLSQWYNISSDQVTLIVKSAGVRPWSFSLCLGQYLTAQGRDHVTKTAKHRAFLKPGAVLLVLLVCVFVGENEAYTGSLWKMTALMPKCYDSPFFWL